MLGKAAGGLFWMFRNLERSENTSRLVDAGFRMALTRQNESDEEWKSVISTAGARDAYFEYHEQANYAGVIDFLLRDRRNPSSVINLIENARNNARLVRTSLTREVWEATNEAWMGVHDVLAKQVRERDLPEVLGAIRQHSALVRGALHGTMLRNEIFDFCRLGTFLERADNTARIVDVKYYVLLPSVSLVGSSLDNVQWESILRSASVLRPYRWVYQGEMSSRSIAEFLILDRTMPRSLAFCAKKIADNLGYLEKDYNVRHKCHELSDDLNKRLENVDVEDIFDVGLHQFISGILTELNGLGRQIESDFRFHGSCLAEGSTRASEN
ncbi:MAG: alpha-E domain-containing protein [Pseudomonadota bacterium]